MKEDNDVRIIKHPDFSSGYAIVDSGGGWYGANCFVYIENGHEMAFDRLTHFKRHQDAVRALQGMSDWCYENMETYDHYFWSIPKSMSGRFDHLLAI